MKGAFDERAILPRAPAPTLSVRIRLGFKAIILNPTSYQIVNNADTQQVPWLKNV